jgi:hypothetical protein
MDQDERNPITKGRPPGMSLDVLSVLAGLISLVSGVLVFFGLTRFVIGVAFGAFSLGGRKPRAALIGMAMSVAGVLLAVAGLFR